MKKRLLRVIVKYIARRISHTSVAIFFSVFLSLLTLIAVAISGDWSARNVFNIIYFMFLNFTIFSLNAIIFSKKRRYVPEIFRRPARISFILIYSVLYFMALISFIKTDQIYRVQTLIFLLGIGPLRTMLFVLAGIILIGVTFIFVLNKKSTVKDLRGKKRKKIKILFWLNLILFLVVVLINILFIKFDASIISDTSMLIAYDYDDVDLVEVSNISKNFDGYNVVFILLESLSAERVGYYGYERDVSPNIDEIANRSIVFSNAYTTASHSDYAQPGILSSRYMFTSPIRTDLGDLESPRKFIWDVFKENNYSTGYFSSQDDRWQEMDEYLDHGNLDEYSFSISDGKTDYGSGFAKKDYDHITADKALDWLNLTVGNNGSFFLYLNFQSTHNPNAYPDEYDYFKSGNILDVLLEDSEKISKYDNSLRYVDEQVGRVVSFVEYNNLSNNTIIAITSDHGHDLEFRHNLPGHGFSIYDEELIVPAIVYLPGVEANVVDEKVSHIDFVPTFIDLFDYDIPEEFQGESMKKNRPIYFVTQSHKYKIGIIENDIKVIVDMNSRAVEVYNLTEDPRELHDINSKKYNSQILKLLFWQFCQTDYYEKEKWRDNFVDRCSVHNRFRV